MLVNTVLLTFSDGSVAEPADRANPGLAWTFRTPQELVLMRPAGGVKVMKLATVIEENKCDCIYSHNRLPGAGLVPPELVLKKQQFFVPGAEGAEKFRTVFAAVSGRPQARFIWEVEVRAGKVWPVAVSLVNSKQLLLLLGQRIDL